MFAGTRWLWTMEEMVIITRRGSGQKGESGPLSYGQSFYPFCYGTKPTEQDFQIMWSVPALMYGNYDGIEHLKISKFPHCPFPIFNEILMMTLFGLVNPNCKIKTSLCTKTKHDRIPWVWAHCRAGISPPQAPTRLGQTKQGPATRVDSRTTLFIL